MFHASNMIPELAWFEIRPWRRESEAVLPLVRPIFSSKPLDQVVPCVTSSNGWLPVLGIELVWFEEWLDFALF